MLDAGCWMLESGCWIRILWCSVTRGERLGSWAPYCSVEPFRPPRAGSKLRTTAVEQAVLHKNRGFFFGQFWGFDHMIKARPLSCDLRESHKKAGSFRSSRKATFLHINQLSFLQSYTVCALLRAPFFLLFCCQVMFCALVYFVWVFVLSQFPSHTRYIIINIIYY